MKGLFSGKTRRGTNGLIALLLFAGTLLTTFGSALSVAHGDASGITSVVEEFENTTLLTPSSAKANSVKLNLTSRPGPVRYGYHAVGLAYDFTGTTGTSAAYINLKDAGGTAGRTLEGYPKRIGMWVYGDANNHWLRGQLQDAAGTKPNIDFTSSGGLNWTGWKYVTAAVPANLKTPIKLNQLYIVETKDTNKNSGTVYFDQVSAVNTSTTVYALDLAGLTPMKTGDTMQAKALATYDGSTEPVQLTTGVTYASSNPEIATVDASGVVRALQPGTATITASASAAPQASFALTVSAEAQRAEKLELSAAGALETGQSGKVRVYAGYAGMKDPVEILSGASFTSSNPAVASVDAAGLVKALKAGSAAISVSFGGVTSAYDLTVSNPVPVLQRIDLMGLKAMNIGDTQQAKVVGTYTMTEDPVEITSGVAFKSSSTDVATISGTGLITANKIGATRITATYNGKSSDFMLVVNMVKDMPKREMRAAWIATVDNIDWPKKGVVDAEQQKRDFSAMLDELRATGINTVITQVKPTSDAFYPSQYGPWSQWLTGVQGKDPGYNPLAFMIEEAHKRNMEFHAWFNPYRISMDDQIGKLVENHPARQHPDWVVSYGGKLYFNPGIPEAKAFIISGVMEVVKNYDIDGVHFDDYFYPYPVAGTDFPDDAQFSAYGAGFASKADWRRNNVNTFIQQLETQIKQEKGYVKFGISPFGIWRNKADDPNGSETNGLSSYDALYADTRKWVQEGWIDYITPQIYWYFGYSPAAYEKLIDWWAAQTQGRSTQFYVGHAAYRIGSAEPAWQNPDEMVNQITYNRNFDGVKGSFFFSTKSLQGNPLGFTDRLKQDLYRYPALVPAMPWLDSVAPQQPVLNSAIRRVDGVELKWTGAAGSDEAYYVVYRFEGNQAGNLEDASRILTTVRKTADAIQKFTDRTAVDGQTYSYVVTSADRTHNESAASNTVMLLNKLDTAPPVTSAVVQGTVHGGWYTSDVTVNLTASDDLTGVELTEYSLNGGVLWQPYGAPIAVTEEGSHTILYRSTDRTGNVETAQSVAIPVDKTPPVILIAGAGTYTVDQTVLITCTASDTVSGVTYSSCASPLVDAPAYKLSPGTHTVTAQAEDAAGHIINVSAEYTVKVTLDSLINLIRQWIDGPGAGGILNSLTTKLTHGQWDAFHNEVLAQKGKKLAEEYADLLIAWVKELK